MLKKIRQEKQYQVFTNNFLCRNDKIFIQILEQYQIFVRQNVSILLMRINSITQKKKFYFFFFIF